MYSYGTILRVKNVQRCPFVGTAPVTSYCVPKGKMFYFFSLLSLCRGAHVVN